MTLFDNIGGVEWLDWHLHPDVVLLCVTLLGAYFYAINVLRPRLSDAGRVKHSQVALYLCGVLAIFIATGTPIHDLSEQYLLSVHMVQHVLPVTRVVLHPLVTFGVFNFLIVVTHLPLVVDYALREHWFHFFVHAALVGAALMMWWPVVGGIEGAPRLTYPYQMAYLFVQSLLPAVIASFITFSQSPVYEFYAQAPRIWWISAVEDQQLAGGIMKITGTLILWSFIGVAFFKWYAKEEAESKGPAWSEVEEELRELGISGRQ